MALVRITPENAVDTVRQQLDTLAESVAGAGRAPAILKLAHDAGDLRELAASGCLEVEFLGLGGLHPAWSGIIAKWLGIEPEPLAKIEEEATAIDLSPDLSGGVAVVRVRSQLEIPPRRAGARVAPILVVASGQSEAPDKERLSKILEQIKSRPLTLLLAPKGAAWAKALSGLGSRDEFVCKPRELEDIASADMTLADSLERPPWQQAGALAAAWSIAGSLESLYQAFSVALEKEDRAARAKKASVEQRSQQLQGTPMPTEILGELRGIIQKKFDRFQKSVSQQLKDLVAPQEGSLWREIDTAAGNLDRFDTVKKPKSDMVTIPEDFQQPILDHIREVLGSTCHSSLVNLHDFLRDIKDETERLLEDRGGPPVVLHFQHLPSDRVEAVLDRSLVIQRPYKGDITRKGVMDMFMAARRYQMLFFMIFSAFGLSFIRSFTAFTIPAGLMLMAYGFLNVFLGFKQQRAEAEEKEMDKAKDSLRAELSRAMSEVQKLWDQTLSNFMGEQQSAALELIEGAVRSSSALGSRQAAGDKELVQQQIKSLDAAQRKLAEGVKNATTAEQDLKEIRGSLIEFFVTATTPPSVDAAVAGAVPAAKTPAAPASAAAGDAAKRAAEMKAQAEQKLAKLRGKSAPGPSKPTASAAKAGGIAATAKAKSGTGAGAAGDAAKRVADMKAQAQQKLAKLRGKAGGAAAKSATPDAKPATPGTKPATPQAKPAGGAAKADPEKLKRQAQERLKALKEKAQAKAKTPAAGPSAKKEDRV